MAGIPNNQAVIRERREKLWTLLTRGMKTYEIAKELNVDNSTVSRDIKHLTAQSQDYLNNLARETLPFMYQPRLRVSKRENSWKDMFTSAIFQFNS